MSDQQTAYINTYIDFAVDTAHGYLNDILQLKTKLKLANDIINQKDSVITALQSELEKDKSSLSEMDKTNDNARQWEERYHSMVNRTSHMETLTNQYNQLKKDYIDLTEECDKLKKQIENLKSPKPAKKTINTKDNKSTEVIANTNIVLKVDSTDIKTGNDDF
jgi:predicted RNase H-like nuclease (RuvC/YqgF family)